MKGEKTGLRGRRRLKGRGKRGSERKEEIERVRREELRKLAQEEKVREKGKRERMET